MNAKVDLSSQRPAGMIAAPRSGWVGAGTPPTSTDERSHSSGLELGKPNRTTLGLT